jgi:hypothetical protein
VVLGFRYQGFGLPGQAVTITPREQLLIRGGVAMVVWTALGVLLVFALELIHRRMADSSPSPRLRRVVDLGFGAAAVVSLLLLRVWWPLLALGAVVLVAASIRWRSRPVVRFLVCALAVGVVAVAYEADRLRFIVEQTCVDTRNRQGSECGLLIGQTDRGIYLGRLATDDRPSELVFVPAPRVERASTVKRDARVIAPEARARRRPIRSRLLSLDIR